jgi:hypothetical protein
MPIATAPRDGSVFMVFVPHEMTGFQFVAVVTLDGRICCMMSGDDFTGKATMWHPVIPLPNK